MDICNSFFPLGVGWPFLVRFSWLFYLIIFIGSVCHNLSFMFLKLSWVNSQSWIWTWKEGAIPNQTGFFFLFLNSFIKTQHNFEVTIWFVFRILSRSSFLHLQNVVEWEFKNGVKDYLAFESEWLYSLLLECWRDFS